jgi:hypothetical protein
VPIDVTVDTSGDVYVADRDNNRIQKFTNTGTFLMQWGSPGSCSWDGQFAFPADVAADPSSGNIFVAYGQGIQEFTNSGTFVRQWEGPVQLSRRCRRGWERQRFCPRSHTLRWRREHPEVHSSVGFGGVIDDASHPGGIVANACNDHDRSLVAVALNAGNGDVDLPVD